MKSMLSREIGTANAKENTTSSTYQIDTIVTINNSKRTKETKQIVRTE
jgi:hypothetical protein